MWEEECGRVCRGVGGDIGEGVGGQNLIGKFAEILVNGKWLGERDVGGGCGRGYG